MHKPAAALIGDAKPILQRLLDVLPAHNAKRASRRAEMEERQAAWRQAPARSSRRRSPSSTPSAPSCPRTASSSMRSRRSASPRGSPFPVYKPRTFLSPGYQDNLGWGFATALGAQDARRDVPVVSISGDGGFMFTANEMATAMRHRIPLTDDRVQRRRLRQRPPHPGGAITATA